MKTKIALLVSLIVFAMTTCSNPPDEDLDKVLLEINFGQDEWPPDLKYEIKVNGETICTSTGPELVSVSVPMGSYYISVTAFSDDIGGTVFATGDREVILNARYNSIDITLKEMGVVATPKAAPPAGQVPFGAMEITLSTTTSGATIHYTRGNDTEPPTPTTSSPIYPDVPIILDNSVGTVITLKAIAVKSDMRQSDTLITSYTIISTGEVAEPVANLPSCQVISGASVTLTLSSLTSGAEIWYTINGATPVKGGSTLYTSPISISNITTVTTIRAIAFKDGMTASTMLEIVYTPLSIEMQWIPAGKFTMGQTGLLGQFALIVATPVHEVTLTQGFYIGKYQVTQEQYAAVMGSNPSYYHGGSGREHAAGEIQEKRPVEQVSWYDALVFCNKLSLMVGLIPAYKIDGSTNPDDWGDIPTSYDEFSPWNAVEIVSGSTGYRLPTEAQWEYACRAGTTTIWFHGNEETGLGNYGWYIVNSGDMTHEVGRKLPNAWSLYDMHGNVWERCWDWSGAYSAGAQTDPLGALFADTRVSRGGSWGAANCFSLSSAFRSYQGPANRTYGTGLRVVRP